MCQASTISFSLFSGDDDDMLMKIYIGTGVGCGLLVLVIILALTHRIRYYANTYLKIIMHFTYQNADIFV